MSFNLSEMQSDLRAAGLHGWLFYDFRGRDPIAQRILDLPPAMRTRRWFYFVPAKGTPKKLVHKIETESLAAVPGDTLYYSAQEELRGNLKKLSEIKDWWAIVHGDFIPTKEDGGYLASAAALLPAEPWDENTWKSWTDAIKNATGRKGRELFHPLRLALTGREDGPEMKQFILLLGRQKIIARLKP